MKTNQNIYDIILRDCKISVRFHKEQLNDNEVYSSVTLEELQDTQVERKVSCAINEVYSKKALIAYVNPEEEDYKFISAFTACQIESLEKEAS